MKHGIREQDIRDFEKYAAKLNEVITRIREHAAAEGDRTPHIYATPNRLNLMSDNWERSWMSLSMEVQQTLCVSSVVIDGLESGDW